MSAVESGAFGALILKKNQLRSKAGHPSTAFDTADLRSKGNLTRTESWCSCGWSNRICCHLKGKLQSCAQRGQPICDPKPRKEIKNVKSLKTIHISGMNYIYLKPGPVPGSVPVCWSLQMPKLDLIGTIGATDSNRKFHLKKLVRLRPFHLKG